MSLFVRAPCNACAAMASRRPFEAHIGPQIRDMVLSYELYMFTREHQMD